MLGGKTLLLSSAAMCAALVPVSALAQETDDENGADENGGTVIIVTAQKRAENLAEVPMSITAITGEALVTAGVSEAADLVKVVPGFNYQQGAFGTSAPRNWS